MLICRSIVLQLLNIDQNPSEMTLNQLKSFLLSIPHSNPTNLTDHWKERTMITEEIWNLLKNIEEHRYRILILKEMLTKSVLYEDPSMEELTLNSMKFFDENSVDHRFVYPIDFEEKKINVYLYSKTNHFNEKDFSIDLIDHSLMNYSFEEKYSLIYQIHLKRLITSVDQLFIALPLFPLSDHLQFLHSLKSSQQRLFIRLERRFHRLIYLPIQIESFNEMFYGIFSLPESFSHFTVEALLCYPFERLKFTSTGVQFIDQRHHLENDSI